MNHIIGHESQISSLRSLIQHKRHPHAMLFSGSAGIGKRLVAYRFAYELFEKEDASNLHLMDSGCHPDLFVITPTKDRKTGIKVDDIRALSGKLVMKPYSSNYIIAIIDKADTMNSAACNALLKTLEEPSQHVRIILISSAPHTIPETIISRCQQIIFGHLTAKDLTAIVSNMSKELTLSKEVGQFLVSMCLMSSNSKQHHSSHISEDQFGCLEILNLDRFIDPTTLRFIDHNKAKQHLESISETFNKHYRQFSRLTSMHQNQTLTDNYPIYLASEGLKEIDSSIFWCAMLDALRTQMITSAKQGKNPEKWSALIETAIQSYEQIRNRNLNPLLHLTCLFLDIHDLAKQK